MANERYTEHLLLNTLNLNEGEGVFAQELPPLLKEVVKSKI